MWLASGEIIYRLFKKSIILNLNLYVDVDEVITELVSSDKVF